MVTGIDKLSGMTAIYERVGGGQADAARAVAPTTPSNLDIRKHVAKQEQEIANDPLNKSENSEKKSAEKNGEKSEVTANEITKLVNEMLAKMNVGIKFALHEKSGRMMVNIINQESNQVVREYPSKDFLDMMAKISQQIGLMVDKKI